MGDAIRMHPVALVGAGPGDPDLLTVKALRLIRAADVVVYDRLVSEAILDLVPSGTMRIFAGKRAKKHYMPQSEINELLSSLALAGRKTVRLKGGDPFTFGRGSEEAEYLARNGLPFEVVPGISASGGCAAYAGIPLTHRDIATNVKFITGHRRDGRDLDFNWDLFTDPEQTLVVYMGLQNIEFISEGLIAAGMDRSTPAAAIQKGTLPDQKTSISTIGELPRRVVEDGFGAPTLIVVGRVVALADQLAWRNTGEANENESGNFRLTRDLRRKGADSGRPWLHPVRERQDDDRGSRRRHRDAGNSPNCLNRLSIGQAVAEQLSRQPARQSCGRRSELRL